MTAAIGVHGISVGYGAVPVVTALDLELHPGEVVALLGPNGAGKSTTMKCLAGVLQPSAGHVEMDAAPAPRSMHRRARSGLRYVSEERSIIRSLSTRDNLRLGPGGVDEAVELFPELKPLLRRPAGLLSGGEQQILALARALSGEPRVLLADELSLGLAPMIVERLLAAAKAAADRGVAVLLVEQQVRSALSVADRGYVMQRGRLQMSGTTGELQRRSLEIESLYLATSNGSKV